MIDHIITSYLNSIIDMTKCNKLRWRYIRDYIDNVHDNVDLNEYLMVGNNNEYSKIINEKSFFLKKDDRYLVILENKRYGAKNKEECNELELLGVLSFGGEVIQIPTYLNSIFELQKEIINYIQRKGGTYSLEMSEILELFSDIIN